MKIIIGTQNPDKISGTLKAFQLMFREEVNIIGKATSSDVSDQPKSDPENRAGASNRCYNLFLKYGDEYDYYIGVESGLKPSVRHPGLFIMRDWVCIRNAIGQKSEGSNGGTYLAEPICELIRAGISLSQAMRRVFPDYTDVGGTLAYLSHDATTRGQEVTEAVKNALIPFLHPEIYSSYLNHNDAPA